MPKYRVTGTAHAAFEITVDAEDEDSAQRKVEEELAREIEFHAPYRCALEVDVSIRETTRLG